MRVLVDGEVFTRPAWHSSLISLFDMAVQGRHRVFPDPHDAPEFMKWLEKLGSALRGEVRFAIESGLDLESRLSIARCEKIAEPMSKESRLPSPGEAFSGELSAIVGDSGDLGEGKRSSGAFEESSGV